MLSLPDPTSPTPARFTSWQLALVVAFSRWRKLAQAGARGGVLALAQAGARGGVLALAQAGARGGVLVCQKDDGCYAACHDILCSML